MTYNLQGEIKLQFGRESYPRNKGFVLKVAIFLLNQES